LKELKLTAELLESARLRKEVAIRLFEKCSNIQVGAFVYRMKQTQLSELNDEKRVRIVVKKLLGKLCLSPKLYQQLQIPICWQCDTD
jgi:hypothetical protein